MVTDYNVEYIIVISGMNAGGYYFDAVGYYFID